MTNKYYLELRSTTITASLIKFYSDKITSSFLNKDTFLLEITDMKQKIVVSPSDSLNADLLLLKFYQSLHNCCKELHTDSALLRQEILKLEHKTKKK